MLLPVCFMRHNIKKHLWKKMIWRKKTVTILKVSYLYFSLHWTKSVYQVAVKQEESFMNFSPVPLEKNVRSYMLHSHWAWIGWRVGHRICDCPRTISVLMLTQNLHGSLGTSKRKAKSSVEQFFFESLEIGRGWFKMYVVVGSLDRRCNMQERSWWWDLLLIKNPL